MLKTRDETTVLAEPSFKTVIINKVDYLFCQYKWMTLLIVALFISLYFTAENLRTPEAPLGIISFELAFNPDTASRIITSWQREGLIDRVYRHLYSDYPFMVCYSLLLAIICFKLTTASKLRNDGIEPGNDKNSLERIDKHGYLIAAFQVIAGICDAIENLLLLLFINNKLISFASYLATTFATIKFLLLSIGLFYIAGVCYRLLGGRDFFQIIYAFRFNIFIMILSVIAITIPEQASEAIRVLAEDWTGNPSPLFFFFLSVILFSLLSWYLARIIQYLLKPAHLTSILDKDDNNPFWKKLYVNLGLGSWQRMAAANIPRLCAVIPLVAIGISCHLAIRSNTDVDGRLFNLTSFFISLAFVGYLLLVIRFPLSKVIARIFNLDINRPAKNAAKQNFLELKKTSRVIIYVSFAFWLAIALYCLFMPTTWTNRIGTIATVFSALSIWLSIGSLLVYLGEKFRVPFLGITFLGVFIFSAVDLNDNHRIRLISSAKPKPKVVTLDEEFSQWYQSRKKVAGKPLPVIIVATEGGGIRAGYFTALVLAKLQQEIPTFKHHLFAISSVSGGSLGAATFAGLAARHQVNTSCNNNNWEEEADNFLANDLLTPLIARGCYTDVLQRFLPVPFERLDRARGLEASFEEAWQDYLINKSTEAEVNDYCQNNPFSNSFFQLREGRNDVPLLFLNTTNVDTGGRMVVSQVSSVDPDNPDSVTINQLNSDIDFALSTAVGLSARFPLFLPPGYILRKESDSNYVKYRFVDGGYYENSGALTAIDILNVITRASTDIKPIVIHIDSSPEKESYKKSHYSGFNEVAAPIMAVINGTSERARNADGMLTNRTKEKNGIDFKFNIDNKNLIPLPTGWLLSQTARTFIKNSIKSSKNESAIREIKSLLEN